MQVIRTVAELQSWSDAARAAGRRVALVPTMGALHRGHLALVDEAHRTCDRVVVSIFVNPTQFNDPDDLAAYPRTFDADAARCREAGVDAVFAPDAAELYPDGNQTTIDVAALSRPLCGASRPGHFRGVATVVAKLLLAARPDVAVFGEKDFQQLAVLRRMAADLCFAVEIVGAPIVREADGVALSSRNALLHPDARREATVLVRALDAAERAIAAGETRTDPILHTVRNEIDKASLGDLDYAELRDPGTLEAVGDEITGSALLALAVFFRPPEGRSGSCVRLIDNRVLALSGESEESS